MEGIITDAQASLISRELLEAAAELRRCIRTLLPEREQSELLQPVKICIKANVLLFGMDSLCLWDGVSKGAILRGECVMAGFGGFRLWNISFLK